MSTKKLVIVLWMMAGIGMLLSCTAPPVSTPSPTVEITVEPEPTNTPAPLTIAPAADDPCSVAGQQQQIEEAFAQYQAEDDALITLNRWVNEVTAEIAAQCQAEKFELTDPAELESLLEKLYKGGYVIYVRHTHTDRSRGDTDVTLGSCETQRILSERGRDEAFMIRNAYDQLDLPISQIISTQYCRTLETAILAFDVPFVVTRVELTENLPQVLSTVPELGTNTMVVAHIGTLRQWRELDDTFEEGDSFVYRPMGDGGYEFVGRIGLYDWPMLATLTKQDQP
ncbi:MAG: hypothetical protein AAF902_04085 [Chloroflexota bacterium]